MQMAAKLNHLAVNHTYNQQQIEWFKAGGALNIIRASVSLNYRVSSIGYRVSPTYCLTRYSIPTTQYI